MPARLVDGFCHDARVGVEFKVRVFGPLEDGAPAPGAGDDGEQVLALLAELALVGVEEVVDGVDQGEAEHDAGAPLGKVGVAVGAGVLDGDERVGAAGAEDGAVERGGEFEPGRGRVQVRVVRAAEGAREFPVGGVVQDEADQLGRQPQRGAAALRCGGLVAHLIVGGGLGSNSGVRVGVAGVQDPECAANYGLQLPLQACVSEESEVRCIK